jgi:hypothetical protein
MNEEDFHCNRYVHISVAWENCRSATNYTLFSQAPIFDLRSPIVPFRSLSENMGCFCLMNQKVPWTAKFQVLLY